MIRRVKGMYVYLHQLYYVGVSVSGKFMVQVRVRLIQRLKTTWLCPNSACNIDLTSVKSPLPLRGHLMVAQR